MNGTFQTKQNKKYEQLTYLLEGEEGRLSEWLLADCMHAYEFIALCSYMALEQFCCGIYYELLDIKNMNENEWMDKNGI